MAPKWVPKPCKMDPWTPLWTILGPAWGPKVDFGSHFGGNPNSSVLGGLNWNALLSPRVAQGTPRGTDGHQKDTQMDPAEVPKERKNRKKRKLRHLDFSPHYGGLATFTPLGGARDRKKANKISSKKQQRIQTHKIHKKTQKRRHEIEFVRKMLKKGSCEEYRGNGSHALQTPRTPTYYIRQFESPSFEVPPADKPIHSRRT